MEKYFGFNLNDLLSDCIPSLFTILKSSFEGNHRSIREKYSINYGGVSTIQPKPTIPGIFFLSFFFSVIIENKINKINSKTNIQRMKTK